MTFIFFKLLDNSNFELDFSLVSLRFLNVPTPSILWTSENEASSIASNKTTCLSIYWMNLKIRVIISFLSKSLQERFDIASGLREMSNEETGNKKNEIMDVNRESVLKISSEFSINKMIHGHTHRPFIHKDENLVRVVLSDWENEVNYATVIDGEISLETF